MALQAALGWLQVLVALVGVVVCIVNLGRSRWVYVLLGGFAIDGFVSAAFRVSSWLMARGTLDYSRDQWAFVLLSFLGVIGSSAIVGGLALLLAERGSGPKSGP